MFRARCVNIAIQGFNTGWFSFDMKEAVRDTRGQVSVFCVGPPLSVETDRADISCVFSLGVKLIIVSQRVLNSIG